MANQFSNKSITLVVFGATGDLMARKLAPALFFLFKEKKLPPGFKVVGVSRRELSEEGFREKIREFLSKYPEIIKDRRVENFLKLFTFVRGFFSERYTYEDLARLLNKKSKRFFYLAVPPKFYKAILKNLSQHGVVTKDSNLLIEKPQGLDLKSGRELERLLERSFSEEQIYRVDHYLAKDGLRELFDFRFKKKFLEKIWNREFIESIEIRLWETLGVEGRGEFYDSVGALRDVGQNHLLMMLALATMPGPRPEKRAQILKSLKRLSRKEIKNFTFRAQYRGYRQIKGVKRNSRTETYFKLRAFLKDPRFRGIPIFLESGKCLPEVKKEIRINFRDGKKLTFPMEIKKRRYQYVEEYKTIFEEIFKKERTWFLSKEEVFQMWRFADPLVRAFKKNLTPLKFYNPGELP